MKFFTADGKEVSTVVRGENYISMIDPATFRDVRRIETQPGPGMVVFHPTVSWHSSCPASRRSLKLLT
jgi:hypothetical protein